MIFNKDQYDFSISNDIVIITANDMFDDMLRHNSFMLAASTSTMKNILSLLDYEVSVLAVDDFSNASGDFGTFVIYDEEGESTSIPVYECRLPGNQLRITNKDEINGIKTLIRDLIRDYAAEMQLPLNFMYTKNHRVYPEDVLMKAMLDMNEKVLSQKFFGEQDHPIEIDRPHNHATASVLYIPWTPSSHMDNEDTGYRKVRDLRSIISLGKKYRTPSVEEISKAISECIPVNVINSKFKMK